jgi:hypothetical protein
MMNRTPPTSVLAELRKEVGFGCPVEGCGNPYLTWHHFDPPWSERQHHEPNGIIALCQQHHSAADVGAFTTEQLDEMKARGRDRADALGARFEWMRHRLLAVVGGTFCYEVGVFLQIQDRPVLWFHRDEEQRLLLNIDMPATIPEARMHIKDNFWTEIGEPKMLECPPSGKLVSVTYENGDLLRVEFFEVPDGGALSRRYEHADLARRYLEEEDTDGFPITAVDVRMRLMREAVAIIDLDAKQTRIGGMTMTGSFMAHCGVGFQIG